MRMTLHVLFGYSDVSRSATNELHKIIILQKQNILLISSRDSKKTF